MIQQGHRSVATAQFANSNKKAAIYLCCSTAGKKTYGSIPAYLQNPDVQLTPLLELIQHRDWNVHRIYVDHMSGDRQARTKLEALRQDAHQGKFHVVVVWRFDRFAQSVKQLVLGLDEFRSLGIDFVSHQENLDTSTLMGKAMLALIAAMAELERSVIRERIMAGIERARRYGTRSGRPMGRPKRGFDRERVVELRRSGLSLRQIAHEMGIGLGTATRTLQAASKLRTEALTMQPKGTS